MLSLLVMTRGDVWSQVRGDLQPAVDILDYAFDLDLTHPPMLSAEATVAALLVAPTASLTLNLQGMTVVDVRAREERLDFRHEDSRLTVALPSDLVPLRDTIVVRVQYRGNPSDGLLFGGDSQTCEGIFGDNWPDRARCWLPVVDHPSDKASVTWRIRVAAGCDALANGTLTSVSSGAGGAWREFVWREQNPIPTYVMVVAIGRFMRYNLLACGSPGAGQTGFIPHELYVSPDAGDAWPGPFCAAPAILGFYEHMIGPYPYDKLAHVQSWTRFGGMENASLIFYNDRGFRERTIGTGLIAHEMAHQWFGDAVTIEDWPHLWLSEGFATYLTALWIRRERGEDVFRDQLREMRTQILADARVRTRPVVDTLENHPSGLLNVNTYQKGAWVLHMLRNLASDSVFFDGLRKFYAEYRHGNASTDSFRRVMERAAGADFGTFFDQWLNRPGVPAWRYAWKFDSGRKSVVLSLEQTNESGLFSVPLEIDLVYPGGERLRRQVMVPAVPSVTFTISSPRPEAPSELLLDPDVELLGVFEMSPQNQ